MLQVAQLTAQLEKLLDGPTVSRSVGQKAINVISNLIEGDSQVISESANRYNSNNTHLHGHILYIHIHLMSLKWFVTSPAGRLVRLVDEVGLKLVVVGDSEIASSNSLVLAVRTVDGTNFPTTSVDIFNTDNVEVGWKQWALCNNHLHYQICSVMSTQKRGSSKNAIDHFLTFSLPSSAPSANPGPGSQGPLWALYSCPPPSPQDSVLSSNSRPAESSSPSTPILPSSRYFLILTPGIVICHLFRICFAECWRIYWCSFNDPPSSILNFLFFIFKPAVALWKKETAVGFLHHCSYCNEMNFHLPSNWFHLSALFLQDSALDNQITVSPVLGSSVANLSISNLNENISFTIRKTNPITVSVVAIHNKTIKQSHILKNLLIFKQHLKINVYFYITYK